jgi:hypothetical protein
MKKTLVGILVAGVFICLTNGQAHAARFTQWAYTRASVGAGESVYLTFDRTDGLKVGNYVQVCFRVRTPRQAIAVYMESGDGYNMTGTTYANNGCVGTPFPESGVLYAYLDNTSAWWYTKNVVVSYRYYR